MALTNLTVKTRTLICLSSRGRCTVTHTMFWSEVFIQTRKQNGTMIYMGTLVQNQPENQHYIIHLAGAGQSQEDSGISSSRHPGQPAPQTHPSTLWCSGGFWQTCNFNISKVIQKPIPMSVYNIDQPHLAALISRYFNALSLSTIANLRYSVRPTLRQFLRSNDRTNGSCDRRLVQSKPLH